MGFDGRDDFKQELDRRRKLWGNTRMLSEFLTGLCVPKLAQALFAAAGMGSVQQYTCGQLTSADIERLTDRAADFMLTIKGVKGFDSAQVTAGGIAADEFDPVTLESRLDKGLHAAGEVLDVDGDCGGFNLMFAFGSGILAGLNGRDIPW